MIPDHPRPAIRSTPTRRRSPPHLPSTTPAAYFYNNNYQAAPPPYYVDRRHSAFLQFIVDSAVVTGFNLSSSVSGAWDFRVAVSNPNIKVSITYEEVESNLAYDSAFIADNTLAPFTQGKKNLTTVSVSFAASGSYLNDRALKALSADRSDDGIVGFEFKIFSRVLFDAGFWRIRRKLLRV